MNITLLSFGFVIVNLSETPQQPPINEIKQFDMTICFKIMWPESIYNYIQAPIVCRKTYGTQGFLFLFASALVTWSKRIHNYFSKRNSPALTWPQAKWNSLWCKFHFGQFDRSEISNCFQTDCSQWSWKSNQYCNIYFASIKFALIKGTLMQIWKFPNIFVSYKNNILKISQT